MNWYKMAQNNNEIIIDIQEYSKEIDNTLSNLIEEPINERGIKDKYI